MKHLTTLLLTLLVLGGCGYSSEEECLVKELQECETSYCEVAARDYCDAEFPGKKKRYIYEEKSYPKNWVEVNVDSSKVYLDYKKLKQAKVCLDRPWTSGDGRCVSMFPYHASADRYPKGSNWTVTGTDEEYFREFINDTGDGLKDDTVINVYEKKSVGFFEYHFDWIFKFLFWGIAILFSLGIIMSIVGFFLPDDEAEDEDEYFEEGELVDIPEREALESMTKNEIKAWADAFEFNVPRSLSKTEMINRFVEETDAYVESLEE